MSRRCSRTLMVALAATTAMMAAVAGTAAAAEPWWHVNVISSPASRTGGQDVILVEVANLGDANAEGTEANPITIADRLPAGITVDRIHEEGGGSGFGLEYLNAFNPEGTAAHPAGTKCEPATATCHYTYKLQPYSRLLVALDVTVRSEAARTALNEVRVSGGNVAPVSASRPLALESSPRFGVEHLEMAAEEEGGTPDTQAGSHPFQLTTTFQLNTHAVPTYRYRIASTYFENYLPEVQPLSLPKDLSFHAPPGVIGNPTALPHCPLAVFQEMTRGPGRPECPADTVVGIDTSVITDPLGAHPYTAFSESKPVYNLEPAVGEPARFGFLIAPVNIPVILDTSVRTGGDYSVTIGPSNIPELAGLIASELTFWGVPASHSHDNVRSEACLNDPTFQTTEEISEEPSCPVGEKPQPFMVMPTSCPSTVHTSMEAESWDEPLKAETGEYTFVNGLGEPFGLDGCDRLNFEPEVSVAPDLPNAASASGLEVKIHVPQTASLNPTGDAESNVRDTTVALPAGVTLNPGGADGLIPCSEGEIGYDGQEAPGEAAVEAFSAGLPSPFCPKAAKIGTVDIHTPLLPNDLTGAVYLGEPAPTGEAGRNPFKSLVAMYIVAQDPVSGTLVKLPGQVVPCERVGESIEGLSCEAAGQLISSFKDTPQLPFEDLTLHFFGGGRAPLGTPGLCGSYRTRALFTPWSGTPPVESTSEFKVTSGPNGSSCPSDPRPFTPEFQAGTTNIQAGGFSELRTTMGHPDQDQALGALNVKFPPGLTGSLAHTKLCGEPQAAQGTCGPESLIGHTVVTAGLGSTPAVVKRSGSVYLTGPYNGHGACTVGEPGCAPFGLSIANPAEAGPFDLMRGSACDCVVVRAKVEIDPLTAQLTVSSGDLPVMLRGIPLDLQHVQVAIDRPDFTLNPTSCAKMTISGSMSGAQGASVPISTPFQVANCASLAFKPAFKVSTSGKTSRLMGASLNVKLTYPSGSMGTEANMHAVKVDLPKQLPSNLEALKHACIDSVFDANPAACPPESKVGQARAITPILPVPLAGPAYFVSHGGAKFPELIIVLQGYGVTVDLHGETFIDKAGITSSTFRTIPDVPVGTFELTLPERAKYAALAAPAGLCHLVKTKTVKKKVAKRLHGKIVRDKHGKIVKITKKVKKTIPTRLAMPTAFTAQNGATIHQNTPIEVTGCGKTKKSAKVIKHRRKG